VILRAAGWRLSHTNSLVRHALPCVSRRRQSVCELLGFDPLYLACEGRLVAVVAPETAEAALAVLRGVAPQAAIVGEIGDGSPRVILRTAFGGERSLDELEDDPLPRIC
jgi:hydrogenase expression/formation protein HypE